MSDDPRFQRLYELLAGGPEQRDTVRRELWRTTPSSVRAVLVMAAGPPGRLGDEPLGKLTDAERDALIAAADKVTDAVAQARRALLGPPLRARDEGGNPR